MGARSNAHGEWIHCGVCNLRLKYTPRKGSPSSTTKVENAFMVQKMLDNLRPMMGNYLPTASICLAMQKKIDAEEALIDMVDKGIFEQRQFALRTAYPKAKMRPTTGTSSRATNMAEWDVVQEPASAPQVPSLQQDLDLHLTVEERDKLHQLLAERRQAASQPATLAEAYEEEMP